MLLRPLEALNGFALLTLSGLTLLLRERLPSAPGLLVRYALMAGFLCLIVALARRAGRLPQPLQVAVDFYPTAFIPFVFETLGPLIPAARGSARDDLLIAADQALFGVDPTVWLERFVQPFWNDFFYIAYLSYYFVPLLVGGLLWERWPGEAQRYIFTLTFCFYVSYAGYFTIPAVGPRFALASQHSVSIETTPVSRTISRTIDEVEHTKLDAFPSGHTMVAVAVLILIAGRTRYLFRILLPIQILLVISTVYCRYHYVVDALAGVALAFVAVPIGDGLYRWLLEGRESPAARAPQSARS